MALSQDGFNFFVHLHTPVRTGQPELGIVPKKFFALQGESHLLGRIYGRDLNCQLTMTGYTTEADLQSDMDSIQNLAGVLIGTLTSTVQSIAATYANATFLGAKVVKEKQYDGAGLPSAGGLGWWCVLELNWRQIAA